jgi:hypothetical protein
MGDLMGTALYALLLGLVLQSSNPSMKHEGLNKDANTDTVDVHHKFPKKDPSGHTNATRTDSTFNVPLYSIVDQLFLERIKTDPLKLINSYVDSINAVFERAKENGMKHKISYTHMGIIDTVLRGYTGRKNIDGRRIVFTMGRTYDFPVVYFTGHTIVYMDTQTWSDLEMAFDADTAKEIPSGVSYINKPTSLVSYLPIGAPMSFDLTEYLHEKLVYPILLHELIHTFGIDHPIDIGGGLRIPVNISRDLAKRIDTSIVKNTVSFNVNAIK